LLVGDLGGYPAVGGIGLPCPGADVVDVSHVGNVVYRVVVLGAAWVQGPR
jgi:hypothetical protein